MTNHAKNVVGPRKRVHLPRLETRGSWAKRQHSPLCMYVRQVRYVPTYYRSKCYVLNVLNLGFIALTLLLSLTGVVPRKADHDGVRVGLVDHAGELLLALCQGRHLGTPAPTGIII